MQEGDSLGKFSQIAESAAQVRTREPGVLVRWPNRGRTLLNLDQALVNLRRLRVEAELAEGGPRVVLEREQHVVILCKHAAAKLQGGLVEGEGLFRPA